MTNMCNGRRFIPVVQLVYLCWVAILLQTSLCHAWINNNFQNLNLIETVLLQSRLERIQKVVTTKYQHLGEVEGSRYHTYIFPGAGGVDPLVEELCSKMKGSTIIDWSDHRGSIVTAAYDAEAVGTAIANVILQRERNKHEIHFIGISVGAFCANRAATVVHQTLQGSSSPVRLTLLDPFCGRGVLGFRYGKEHFGKYATTAIQILNTDDPVPTTNDPLPNCYCLDVTAAPERNTFVPLPGDSMHSWPVAYFARHFKEPSGTFQRGTVVKVGEC